MKVWDGILISFLPKYLNVQRCLPSTTGGTHSWMHVLVSHFDLSSNGTGICSLTLITCSNIALRRNRRGFHGSTRWIWPKRFGNWWIYKPLFTHSLFNSSTKLIVHVLNLNSLRARGIGWRDRLRNESKIDTDLDLLQFQRRDNSNVLWSSSPETSLSFAECADSSDWGFEGHCQPICIVGNFKIMSVY